MPGKTGTTAVKRSDYLRSLEVRRYLDINVDQFNDMIKFGLLVPFARTNYPHGWKFMKSEVDPGLVMLLNDVYASITNEREAFEVESEWQKR